MVNRKESTIRVHVGYYLNLMLLNLFLRQLLKEEYL